MFSTRLKRLSKCFLWIIIVNLLFAISILNVKGQQQNTYYIKISSFPMVPASDYPNTFGYINCCYSSNPTPYYFELESNYSNQDFHLTPLPYKGLESRLVSFNTYQSYSSDGIYTDTYNSNITYEKGQYTTQILSTIFNIEINVDDPIYLDHLTSDNKVSSDVTLTYSPYYDNGQSVVLQYSRDNVKWYNFSNISFPSSGEDPYSTVNTTGNLLSIFGVTDLYSQGFYFRILKELSDPNKTKTYGNIVGPYYFYDKPVIHIAPSSSSIVCQNSPITFQGSYEHFSFDSSNPYNFESFIEVKLKSEDDTKWRTLSKTLTNPSTSFSYSDIAGSNNWVGQEIQIRPYKMFNGTQKITGDFINITFLPTPNMAFTSTSPKCHGGDDGSFTIKFNDVPEGGSSNGNGGTIPLYITIKKYDLRPIAIVDNVTYSPIDTLGKRYYYRNGVTLPLNVQGNGITINNSVINNEYVKLSAGIFKITAQFKSTSDLCPVTQTLIIDDPDSISTTLSYNSYGSNNARFCDSQGTVNFSKINNGTPPFTVYSLNNTSLYTLPSNAAGKIYLNLSNDTLIKIKDKIGCPVGVKNFKDTVFKINFKQSLPLSWKKSIYNLGCNLSNNASSRGSIEISNISGGVNPYSFTLSRNDIIIANIDSIIQSTTASNLTYGIYKLTLTDNSNCAVDTTAWINQPDTLKASINADSIKCTGDRSNITVSAEGGTKPYSYILKDKDNSEISPINGIYTVSAGKYTLTTTDAKSCETTTSHTITQSDTLLSISTETTQTTCDRRADGSIKVHIKGGTPNYTITLNTTPLQTKLTTDTICQFNKLAPGNYKITVTDLRGCSKSLEVTVSSKVFTANAEYSYQADKYNMHSFDNYGALNFTFENGTAPFTIKKNDGTEIAKTSSNEKVAKFPEGEYYLIVQDANSCEATVKKTAGNFIFHKPTLQLSDITGHSPSCNSGNNGTQNNGSITYNLIVSNSYNKFSINLYKNDTILNNEPSGNSFNNLTIGTYRVKINEDGDTCSSLSAQIVNPSLLVATLTQTQSIQCKGDNGSLTVGADGGGGTYTCYLSTGEKPSDSSISLSLGPFNKKAETYTAYVKDNNNCIATSPSVTLNEPVNLLTITVSNLVNSICGKANGGDSTKILGGKPFKDGYALTITGPTTINETRYPSLIKFSKLLQGTYKATVSDSLGCFKSINFTISDSGFTAKASYVDSIPGFNMHSCDEKGKLNLTFINGTPPYLIKRTDTNEDIATVNAATTDTIECPPSETGYKLSITDSKDCSTTVSDNNNNFVFKKPSLSLSSITGHSPSCHSLNEGKHDDGSISYGIKVSLGYENYSVSLKTYNISPNPDNKTFSGLTTGKYTIVLAETGCNPKDSSVTIADTSLLTASLSINDSIACKGGSTLLSINPDGGTGSYFYSIDKNYINKTLNILNFFTISAGKYTGYVKDKKKGCIATSLDRMVTESDNPLIINKPLSEMTSCNGAADGSVSFSLSGGTPQYHILIITSSDTVKNFNTSDTTFKVEGLLPGSYTAAIRDFRGCSQSIGFDITAKTYKITNVTAQPTICNTKNTGQISCTVENGLGNYNFSLYKYDGTAYTQLTNQKTDIAEAGTSFQDLYNGKYRIISTDKQGCSASVCDVTITTQKPDIMLSATVSEQAFCSGSPTGTLAITRTNGDNSTDGLFDYNIQINGAAYKTISEASASWSLHSIPDGKYHIVVTDDIGCQGSADITMDTLAVPLSLESPASEAAACATSPSGKISVPALTGTRGVTDVVYHLNTGPQSTTGVFTGLIPANNYTVYATYGSTCTTKKTEAISVVASATSPVTFSISPVNQSCTQIKNGKIAVQASSKFGTETYTISKIRITSEAFKDSVMNSGQATFANLKEQSYYITVFDQYQCSLPQVPQITNLNNNPKVGSLTFDSTACNRANNGAVHLAVNQSVDKSPYNYYLYSSGKNWTTGIISGLHNGKDTVRVTDSEGCPSVIPFDLPNTLLPVKLKSKLLTAASCEEASNGTITLNADNGIPGYKFYIPGRDTIAGNNVIFKNFAAHYASKVKVFDTYYCFDSLLFTIPVLPLNEQLSLTVKKIVNASCPGIASGKVSFERANGLAGYWYSITRNDPVRNDLIHDNSSAPAFDGYAKGHYAVSVTDTVHCKATSDFTISEPDNIYITNADSIRVKEFGKPQGKISAVVQGGNHKYQYRWMSINSTGETELESGTTDLLTAPVTFERSGLYAGRYSLEVRDTAQCNGGAWLRQTFTITQPDQALSISGKIAAVTCHGRSDGKIELTGTGGWKGYQYSFNGSYWRNSSDTTGLAAGVYTAYIKDQEDIVFTKQFEVIQPEVLSASLASQNNAQCFGYSDGSAQLTINGGNFPYYLALSSTSGSWIKGNAYPGLAQGAHTIVVKDSLGCSTSVPVTIIQPDQILLSDTLITQSRCMKDNGAIKVQVTGGIPGYTYRWYNDTTPSLSVQSEATELYSGTYKLEVKDSRQCFNTFTLILSDITDLTIDNILTQPALCLYDTTGKASITVSKGNPPYTITWPDNSHDTKVAGLKARENYIVSVADAVGCKVSQAFTIGNLKNLPHPNIAAFDSVACITASNGAARLQVEQVIPKSPYNYYLINNKDTVLKGQSGAAFSYSGLNGYPHSIRVVDSKGCFTDTTFTIPATLRPVSTTLTSIGSASCSAASNGKVNVTAANGVAGDNGYTFILPDRQDTIRGWTAQFLHLPAYYPGVVKVFDRYQCSVISQNFQVPVIAASEQVKLNLNAVVNASCQGYDNGKALFLRSNGAAPFRYIVTPAAQPQKRDTSYVNTAKVMFSGYPQGQYTVSLLDSANCQASSGFIIKDPSSVVISGSTQKVKAKGKAEGRIDVSVTGGNNKFDYQWLKITSGNVLQLIQSGTSPMASPVPLTLDKVPAGNYRLLVRDTAQCHYEGADWITRDYSIVEPQDTLSFSASVIPVSCIKRSDGQITIQGSGGWGGYTYSADSLNWTANGSLQGLPAGNYKLFVKDVEGVVFSKKVPVVQTDSLIISSVSTSPAICNGSKDGSISLQIKGGTSPYYAALLSDTAMWPKLGVINGLPQTATMADSLYTVFVKDSRNCKASVVAHVLQPAPLAVASSSITASRCLRNNGAIQVSISGGSPATSGYSYLWFNNDTSFNSASASALWAKTYQLKITDSHLCQGQFSFTVPDISDLTIDTVITTPVLCYADNTGKASISVSKGNPPYTITWPDKSADNNVTGLRSAANYTVYVSDRLGCHTSKNFAIGSPTQVSIESHTSSQPLCLGVPDGSLKVYATGGTPGYSYLWNTGKKSNAVSGLDQGAYQVTVTDAHNCAQTFGYALTYQHTIYPSLGPDMTICQGNSYKLTPGSYQGYSWTSDVGTSSSDSCLYASKAGHYYVKVTDNDGCIGYDTVAISVSATELQGKFLVATNVEQNDTVMIFETSWPLPDSVQFVLPGCKVIDSGKYYREVIYPETGTYTIGLTAFLNDCLDKISKEIVVSARTTKASSKSAVEKLIQRYTLSPNPNNGQFRTEVTLRENANIMLRLANVGTGIINDFRTYKGSGLYTIEYDMSHLASGIYVLYLQAGNEVATKTFIIQK